MVFPAPSRSNVSQRPFLSTLRKFGAFVGLVIVAITCGELTTEPGFKGDVTILYGDTVRPKVLLIGERVPLDFEVMIGGVRQERARFVLSSSDTNVVSVNPLGDTLVVKNRGLALIRARLVGATVGSDTTKWDTVTVVARAANNVIRPSSDTTLVSLGETLQLDGVSLDANNDTITGGSTSWQSTNPGIATVDNTGRVTAVANGNTLIIASFDGVDPDTIQVTVQQRLSSYRLQSARFGTNQVAFTSLTDTVTVEAVPLDARGNFVASDTLALFSLDPVATNAASISTNSLTRRVVVTANVSNVTGAAQENTRLCASSATVTTATPGCLQLSINQKAVTLSASVDSLRLLSLGSQASVSASAVDSLGRGIPPAEFEWIAGDTKVAVSKIGTVAQITSQGLGNSFVVVTHSQKTDTIRISITNDPDTLTIQPGSIHLESIDDEINARARIVNARGDALANIGRTWRSTNPAVATATVVPSDSSVTVRAVARGTTSLILETGSGAGFRADTVPVLVTNDPATLVLGAANITDTLRIASVGQTDSVAFDFKNGRGVALPRTAAAWRSTNEGVVRAASDGSGILTAMGAGEAFIKAISPGIDSLIVRDSVLVIVDQAAASISVAPASVATITALGTTVNFTATVFNALGAPITGRAVTWSIASGTAATIDPVTGVLTANANGTVTVRATSGSATADRSVTIAQAVSTAQSVVTAETPTLVANGTSTTKVRIQLKDANGNNIAFGGSAVTLAVSPATLGTLTPATPADSGSGLYVTTFTSSTISGAATLAGTVGGVAISNNGLVTLTPAAASQYVVSVAPTLTPVAGSAVTISARLADVNGNAIGTAGNVVTWSSTGGGSFGAATSTTDATGLATVTFTTNTTATPHVVSATTGAIAGSSASINPIAGAAASYAVTTSTLSPVAGAGVLVTARLRDANGNTVPLAGQTVTWSKSDAVNGSFSSATSLTDGTGTATVTLNTHTVAGTSTTVTATTGSLTGISGTITTGAGAATQLTITTEPSGTAASGAAFGQQPAVQLRDANGNPVAASNVTVAAEILTGGGTLGGTTTAQTNASGLATFSGLSITGASGNRTLRFTSSGLTGVTSATVAVGSGTATTIAVSAGNSQSATAGTAVAVDPAVLVTDAAGNPVAGVTVTFAVAAGNGTIDPVAGTVATGVNGVATLTSWTLHTTAGVNTLTATVAGLTGSPVTFTATGTVGAATQIAMNGGNGETAVAGFATATAPSVIVRDANNNPVPGVSVTFAVTGGGGSISSPTGNTVVTNTSGIAALSSWTLGGVAGANTLTASSGALAGSPVGFTATGIAGTGQNIIANSVTSQTVVAGAAATAPSVIVRDANNNVVVGVNVTFAVAAASGTINGGTSNVVVATGPGGVASLGSWTTNTVAGTNTVTAAVGGLTGSPVTFTATGTPGAANNLVANSSTSQSATVTQSVSAPPSVVVRDANNNPVGAGTNVTFSVATGGGTVNGGANAVVATNASGVATLTSWTLGTGAGTNNNSVTATIAGLNTVTFNASGLVGTAATISANTVTTQNVTVGGAATAPSVTVRDANSNPVPNFSVTFTLTQTGGANGSINPASVATVSTDASGVATLSGWTVGQSAGTNNNTVTATGAGLATLTFNASGVAGGANNLVANSVTTQSKTVGQNVDAPPSVLVRDQYNNPVAAGVNVTFTVTAAQTGGLVNGAASVSVPTGANGVATLGSWQLGTDDGTNTVTATIATLNTVTFNATGTAGAAANIAVNGTPSTSATVGTSVVTPPSVVVTDASGNLVAGATVTFTLTQTGGTGGAIAPVSPASVVTNALGVATLTGWTLGQTAGTNNNTVTATTTGVGTTITFDASGTAGTATSIIANSATSQSRTVGLPVTAPPSVLVRDAFNNPVNNVAVTFTTTAGNGTLDPASGNTVSTGTNGIATVTSWTVGTTAGANTVEATVSSGTLTGEPIVFNATGTAAVTSAATSTVVRTGSNNITADGIASSQITVTLLDANSNPVAGKNVALDDAGATSVISPASGTSNASGQVTFTVTSTASETATYTATATDGGAVVITQTAQVTFVGGTQYLVTAPATAAASSVVLVTAQLADALNNPVAQSGKTVNWTKTCNAGACAGGATGGSFASATSITDATGKATVALTVSSDETISHVVTATDNTALTGASNAIDVLGTTSTIANSTNTTEATLTDGTLTVQVSAATFRTVVGGLDVTDFTLNGAPGGVTIGSLTRNSDTEVVLNLDFNGTDFDASATVSVSILVSAFVTGTASTTANTVGFTPTAATVVVITGPATLEGNQSGTYTLTAREPNATTMVVATNEVFALSRTAGSGTATFSNGGSVTIASGTASNTFTYANSDAGATTIQASDGTDEGVNFADATLGVTISTLSASITASTNTTEAGLDNATITVTLTNGQYVAAGLDGTDFALVGAPAGVTIDGSVTRNSATEAVLSLNFNGTDFDVNQSISVQVLASALQTGAPAPVTTGNSVSVTASAASTIAVTAGPATVVGQVVSTVISIEAREANGSSMTVAANEIFELSSNTTSANEQFSSDALGATPITTVQIDNGTATASFYYRDDTAGNWTLTINDGAAEGAALGSVTHNIQVLATTTTIAGATNTTEATLNDGTLQVDITANGTYRNGGEGLDASDFQLVGAPTGVTIASVTFNSTTSVTLNLDFNGTDFDNSPSVTVNVLLGALLTGTANTTGNNQAFTPAAASTVVLTGPTSLDANQVVGPYTLTAREANTTTMTVAVNEVFALSTAAGSGTGVFSTNADGTGVITSLTISSGAATAQFYYQNDTPGGKTLRASDAGDGTEGVSFADADLAVTIDATTALISAASNVDEENLNNGTLTVQIADGTFQTVVGGLDQNDFTLNNAPAGVTIASITRNSDTEVVLNLDFNGTDFDATVAVSVNVLASALVTGAGPVTTTDTENFVADAASAIVVTAGPATVVGQVVSTVISIESRETNGSSMTVAANEIFELSSNTTSANEQFSSDALGATPITTVQIDNGTAAASFYYRDDTAGNWTLTINDGAAEGAALGSVTHNIQVLATTTTIAGATNTTEATLSDGTLTVDITANGTYRNGGEGLDASDFQLVGAPAGVTISGVTFNSTTSVTLDLDFNGTDFDNTPSVTVNVLLGALLTGTANTTGNNQSYTATAASVVEITGPATLEANETGTYTLTSREANGSTMAVTTNEVFALSRTAGAGTATFSNAGSVTIANGSSSNTFTYANTDAGATTIQASDGTDEGTDFADETHDVTISTTTAAITQTSPASLTESTLDASVLTVTLTAGTLQTVGGGLDATDFTLNAPPGVTIASINRVSATVVEITLAFDSTPFTGAQTVSVNVLSTALATGVPATSNTAPIGDDIP